MKWFRVATEGATTDGRKISRQWIEQMAKNFDPKKYGARVWMEHMRGLFHDGPFPALGDVKAVKAEDVEDGKVALFVQLDPTDQLKEINEKRQKVYTSIEVDPEFADTGEAYLIGLAVTDSPASLGTDMLQFSAQQGSASPLAARKQSPHNVFTEAVEIEFDFTGDNESDNSTSLMDSIKDLFSRNRQTSKDEFSQFRTDLENTLGLFVEKHTALQSELESLSNQHNELQAEHNNLLQRFEDLYKELDRTPDTQPRHHATGSAGAPVLTDC